MAQDEQVIYLGHTRNWAESHPPCIKTKPLPGCVAVQMVPCESLNGVMYVPEHGRFRLQRDMGWVVGVGESVDLELGSMVVVRGYDGLWRGDTRYYGVGEPWWDQIPAKVQGDCLIPNHDWVHVEFDKPVSFIDHLHEVFYSSGTVIATGPKVSAVKVGDEVEVKNGHPRNLDFKMDWAQSSWGFVPESTIQCRYERQTFTLSEA